MLGIEHRILAMVSKNLSLDCPCHWYFEIQSLTYRGSSSHVASLFIQVWDSNPQSNKSAFHKFMSRVSLHFLCCYWFFSVNVYSDRFSVTLSHLCVIPAVFTLSVPSHSPSTPTLVPSVVLVAFETVSLCSLSWSQTHCITHLVSHPPDCWGFRSAPLY